MSTKMIDITQEKDIISFLLSDELTIRSLFKLDESKDGAYNSALLVSRFCSFFPLRMKSRANILCINITQMTEDELRDAFLAHFTFVYSLNIHGDIKFTKKEKA